MKKIFIFIILLCLSMVRVEANTNKNVHIDAASAIMIERNSGRIMYEHNIHDVHLTASIAKIMTAIVAIELGDLEQYYVVDKETVYQVGSSIYMKIGDQMKLIDLLYGLLLRSGNDTAHLIAKSVSGSVDDFVSEMNKKAKEIKMTSSVFSNPSGLDEENNNYSTAYDMALLMDYAMDNDVFRTITNTKTYTCKSKNGDVFVFYNKHRLVMNYDDAIGGKTGYTTLAKRTLVTCFSKDGMELIVVTFNCGGDFGAHRILSNYGFENYKRVRVFNQGILDIPDYNITPIVYTDVSYPVKEDEVLRCEIHLLKDPKDEIIGRIYLIVNNQTVRTINVYRYY